MGALTAVGVALAPNPAQAFVLRSKLLGDPRGTPTDLIVDLTITSGEGGYSGSQAFWKVDINSPVHSNVKLDGFYFNLADTIKNLVSFSNFSPSSTDRRGNVQTWGIVSGSNASGSGGANFGFGVDKLDQQAPDVTNMTSLEFLMTANGLERNLLSTDFTTAPFSTGANGVIVGQAGAHLQSLTGGQSGFAAGKIPTPALLPGLIALGAGVWRKRKGEQAAEAKAEV